MTKKVEENGNNQVNGAKKRGRKSKKELEEAKKLAVIEAQELQNIYEENNIVKNEENIIVKI